MAGASPSSVRTGAAARPEDRRALGALVFADQPSVFHLRAQRRSELRKAERHLPVGEFTRRRRDPSVAVEERSGEGLAVSGNLEGERHLDFVDDDGRVPSTGEARRGRLRRLTGPGRAGAGHGG
jgi:hypothetical protein